MHLFVPQECIRMHVLRAKNFINCDTSVHIITVHYTVAYEEGVNINLMIWYNLRASKLTHLLERAWTFLHVTVDYFNGIPHILLDAGHSPISWNGIRAESCSDLYPPSTWIAASMPWRPLRVTSVYANWI